jgi:hypothetical protein
MTRLHTPSDLAAAPASTHLSLLAVVLNTFTNHVNEVAQTEIDFPVVEPLPLAA